MAFVILSAGTLTRSKTRTVSIRAFLGLVLASMLSVLAGGIAVGYGLGGERTVTTVLVEAPPAVVSVAPEAPSAPEAHAVSTSNDNRYLIDRFGELSGRMIQLEAEALELATRIGVIQDFESRIKTETLENQPKGRTARTPPGAPAGGPLLRPVDQSRPTLPPEPASFEEDVLSDELARMEAEIERLAEVMEELDRITTSLNLAQMFFPARLPVDGIGMTSAFGNRVDPFTKRRAFHSGVDFPAPRGTPIYASGGGRVIFSGNRRQYGNTIEIDHGAGIATRYAHASKLLVKAGQIVMPGEKIALIGSSGRSTGPHLHFEILKDGHFVNPTAYLAN